MHEIKYSKGKEMKRRTKKQEEGTIKAVEKVHLGGTNKEGVLQ